MRDVPHELVEHVSWLIYARRSELRSPWRKLICFKQALLALAHLRKNETYRQFGVGVSEATAWRYVDETIEILASWAPGLHEALTGLGEGDFVIADGTLIPTDRIRADEPYYSQKHKEHGMNVQVIARSDGTPLWFLACDTGAYPRPDRSTSPWHRLGLPHQADSRARGPRLPGSRRHLPHAVLPPP